MAKSDDENPEFEDLSFPEDPLGIGGETGAAPDEFALPLEPLAGLEAPGGEEHPIAEEHTAGEESLAAPADDKAAKKQKAKEEKAAKAQKAKEEKAAKKRKALEEKAAKKQSAAEKKAAPAAASERVEGRKPSRLIQSLAKADLFTVMLAVSVAAITFAVLCLLVELATYRFDIKANAGKAKAKAAQVSWVASTPSDLATDETRITAIGWSIRV